MRFGILQRYVMGEVVRAFLLALLTVTSVFVLFGIMLEASRKGLGPMDILRLIPFIVPTSLPFTVPVSLLFGVTVVYGRIAADNEVMAIKACGLSAWTVLKPALILGAVFGVGLLYASNDLIPRANAIASSIVFKNLEDYFYKSLKKEREFNNPRWPFYIKVKDVEGRTMIGATFKHRSKESPNHFDLVVQAERAQIQFLLGQGKALVTLEGATIQPGGVNPDVVLIKEGKTIEIQLPGNQNDGMQADKKVQELTAAEMDAREIELRRLIDRQPKLHAVSAAMWIGSGRMYGVNWRELNKTLLDVPYWKMKRQELETERYFRKAIAAGTFFFVALGAPVGILFARRDFLSAFISCFVPIIIIYYPLTIFGVNLGKEGLFHPAIVMLGNGVLGVLAGFFAIPPVIKH